MSRNRIAYLVLSLLVHLGVLIIVFWNLKGPKESTIHSPPLVIEFKSSQNRAKAQNSNEHHFARRPRLLRVRPQGKPAMPPNLGLVPTLLPNQDEEGKGRGASRGLRGKYGLLGKYQDGQDGFDAATEMNLMAETKQFPFFKPLLAKIEASLIYPIDLVKQRITGEVSVHFVVNQKGVFTGKFLRVEGTDKTLKALVVASVVHALKEPLSNNLWSEQAETILVAQVKFSTFTHGHIPDPVRAVAFKNIFQFKRESYVDPKFNEEFEKFFSRYFPPIIIFPGGFAVDFVRLYQFVDSIGKPDPDDMRAIRIEADREQWERLVP